MTFSSRKNLIPSKLIQLNSLDQETRIGIWNFLDLNVYQALSETNSLNALLQIYSIYLFKLHYETFTFYVNDRSNIDTFKKYYDTLSWNQIFDVLEVTLNFLHNLHSFTIIERFRDNINYVLEKEKSGYRIVEKSIVEITDPREIEEVNVALQSLGGIGKQHLTKALSHLSDREKPDYANASKEAISAVESVVQELINDDKATLGSGIKALRIMMPTLHPTITAIADKIYGFTSDHGGIRHAGDSALVDFHDAKFMIIFSSSFINYLIGKKSQ